MAVKGAIAKEQVIKELLTYFGDRAFKYDKDIRVNCIENGEPVQIKIALTAAKVAVEQGGDAAVPGSVTPTAPAIPKAEMIDFEAPVEVPAPTVEEKEAIKTLMQRLGL